MARHGTALMVVVAAALGALAGCGGDDESPERYVTDLPTLTMVVSDGERVWALTQDELVALDVAAAAAGERVPTPDRAVATVLDGEPWTVSSEGTRPVGVPGVGEAQASSELIADSVAVVDGRVFASRGSDLYELDPDTGEELGMVELPPTEFGGTQEVLWVPLVADGSSLWVTVADGGSWRMSRYDPVAGTLDFGTRLPDDARSAVLLGDRIWVADRRGELIWIDTATGEWTDVPGGFPKGDTILDDSPSLFTGPDGTLWALDQPSQVVSQLDPSSGEVLASFELRYRPDSLVVTATDLVLANGFDDRVTILPRSALTPTP